MTHMDALNLAIANLNETIYDGANTIDSTEVIEHLQKMRDALAHRATAPRKPSAKAIEALTFRNKVEDYILDSHLSTFTAKEIAQAMGTTVQKVSAALTSLVKVGAIVKGDGWYETAEDDSAQYLDREVAE